MISRAALALLALPLRFRCLVAICAVVPGTAALGAVPFPIQGPGVNPANFRVTTFASGVSYPVGMAELSDGSLLVAVTDGPGYFSSNGRLVRFVDANQDGVADGPGTTLVTGLTGGLTSVRIGGNLVFVTGQKKPIHVLRLGNSPGAAITPVDRIDLTYPTGGWLHPHSALAVRPTPGVALSYDMFFQLGSQVNFGATALTTLVALTSTNAGAIGSLNGDRIYKLTVVDRGTSMMFSGLLAIASGLRNPAGFAFHPKTGDFYFQDNGIDGLVDANEPLSADELNRIPAADIGGATVEFFGFPANYTEYRTGTIIGRAGIQPLVAFQPQPDPLTGEESEGPNDIAFAPASFPDGLNNGVFVGFHGKFNLGGLNNEENAMVYVDLATMNYFHFTPSKLPGVGHLDGLLNTRDSLFISDISTVGDLNGSPNLGAIYQIKSVAGPAVHFRWVNTTVELSWSGGVLQSAQQTTGPWKDETNAPGPYVVDPATSPRFFRTKN